MPNGQVQQKKIRRGEVPKAAKCWGNGMPSWIVETLVKINSGFRRVDKIAFGALGNVALNDRCLTVEDV